MGTNPQLIQPVPPKKDASDAASSVTSGEEFHARELARRYRCEFLDLRDHRLDASLLRKVEVGLMFRYNFVPVEEEKDGVLVIAIADPSQLMMIDEIGLLLRRRIKI